MEDKIRAILREQVDPVLQAHFGGSSLSRYEDGVAYVRLTGACAQCPSAQKLLKALLKTL